MLPEIKKKEWCQMNGDRLMVEGDRMVDLQSITRTPTARTDTTCGQRDSVSAAAAVERNLSEDLRTVGCEKYVGKGGTRYLAQRRALFVVSSTVTLTHNKPTTPSLKLPKKVHVCTAASLLLSTLSLSHRPKYASLRFPTRRLSIPRPARGGGSRTGHRGPCGGSGARGS